MDVDGFRFEPPAGFRTAELSVSLRPPLPAGVSAQSTPTVFLRTSAVPTGATLETLADDVAAEISESIANAAPVNRMPFSFEDGHPTVALSYNLTTEQGLVRNYVALRIHGERLCTFAVTIPMAGLSQETAQALMKAIASLRPT